MENNNYIPIIGLEVHVELKTKSKMFCGCSADYFGAKPNTHVCPICLGLPGALPVPNKKAIEWCVMIGLALNCEIPLFSKFDRKNYFYPDLPKGYQISQYDQPFAVNGYLEIELRRHLEGETNRHLPDEFKKKIRIRRVHMEEDTAKLVHEFGNQKSKIKKQKNGRYSLIDFNRSGVPLVEIVTEPDFESANEVVAYLKKLQQIVRYLDVSNADMERGEMRMEPNISLKPVILGIRQLTETPDSPSFKDMRDSERARMTKEGLPNYKVEVKNINSFRFVEKAINFEIKRQRKILESGRTPIQETRGWDDKREKTTSQRTKEEAHDYRYFPEPDIPPIHWRKSQISNLKSQMPELPDQKFKRIKKNYGLSDYDSEILAREKSVANFFEEAVKVNEKLKNKNEKCTDIKTIANWIINKKIDVNNVIPAQLVQSIITTKQTITIDTEELERIVRVVLEKNKKALEEYKKGKTQVIGFLVGCVKKEVNKPLDTSKVKEMIEILLKID